LTHLCATGKSGQRGLIFMMEHTNQPPLSTFTRGTQMGRSPIDGVWLSHGVPVQACSWTAFPDSPGDHRAVIVDFDITQVLGQPCLQVCRPPAHCLVCTLPAIRDRYMALLTAFLEKHQFLHKLYTLYTSSDPRTLTCTHSAQNMNTWIRFGWKACGTLRSVAIASVWAYSHILLPLCFGATNNPSGCLYAKRSWVAWFILPKSNVSHAAAA